MKESIVLYPSPGIGHLVPMVELGRHILKHYPSFSITILITPPPYNTGSTAPYITHISSTTPSINFHHLPAAHISPDSISSPHHEALVLDVILHNNHNIQQTLLTISQTSTIQALIIDMLCTAALDVGASLHLPTYCYYPSPAACLAFFLYLPTIHTITTKSFKDLDCHFHVTGLPPVHARDVPKPLLDRTDKAYEGILEMCSRFPESKGILVNTFEALEPKALKALSDGLCLPNRPIPPIYCIGPLIGDRTGTNGAGDISAPMTWLDSQPSRSVVFLCFGSLGLFSAAQLKEIAIGLEKSGQRFLWVVRNPPTEDKSWRNLAPPEPDLADLMPEGFLDRTKNRGFVVKQWVSQVEVLSRESVGGFVTHCGWNSVLEAISVGVPMVAWPLYAEQRLNRLFLVEAKLALPMDESEGGFVSAAVVENRVKELMESVEGKALRERTLGMRDAAKAAMAEGGSSKVALAKLAESWNQGQG